MKRIFLTLVTVVCLAVSAKGQIGIFPAEPVGPVKDMNAVNNGPIAAKSSQTMSNQDTYKAAKIPYARTHDSSLSAAYGAEHVVDITAIFPDFSKNVNCPSSYEFACTDKYLADIQSAGTKVFFRLGQRIENQIKKYNVYPPKNYKKWAEICEHIIRHYNEGWADGFEYGIEYWEIWNEPDLDENEKDWKNAPRNWGGSPEEFFEFYKVAANHLNSCFPNLKIGGPALCGSLPWAERFLAYMEKNNVELDFFSWHIYTDQPEKVAKMAHDVKALLDSHGYGDVESILNEWNYVRSWSKDFVYTLQQVQSIKGAAFSAATMIACQDAPVDMLMYYDARTTTQFNGLFKSTNLKPLPAYYSLYAWSRLKDYGTQVKVVVDDADNDIFVSAASNEKGTAALICRYNDNDNVSGDKVISVDFVSGVADGTYFGHVLDADRLYSEFPFEVSGGKTTLKLAPEAVVFLEIR